MSQMGVDLCWTDLLDFMFLAKFQAFSEIKAKTAGSNDVM